MSKSPHVEIYRAYTGNLTGPLLWRWRFRSSNGKILSQSSEGYQDPRDLVRGLELSHPGYRMYDATGNFDGVGGWYLCSLWPVTDQTPDIRVRVPEGTVKLWRARRNR